LIERFTSHAREALAAAEREARALEHREVATEHLLLGLLRVEESVAARALRLLEVRYEAALVWIRELVDVGSDPVPDRLSFDSGVRAVVEDAFTGAVWIPSLGRSLVGAFFSPSPTTPWGHAGIRRSAAAQPGSRQGSDGGLAPRSDRVRRRRRVTGARRPRRRHRTSRHGDVRGRFRPLTPTRVVETAYHVRATVR
jgi:ATP-dependent Clp protease ATP-binding subunit ClpC